ncbi:Adenosine deaminase [metagenome]|uniref:Adenosine deaminase n=1 Tax=metagenome TaxID=256318 RepID=A0A2P2C0Y1_9ZZZZ
MPASSDASALGQSRPGGPEVLMVDNGSRSVSAFDRLPKVELHCHVEGTLRPTTLVDLAVRNGIQLPTADLDALYAYDSLDGFLNVFWLGQSTLCTRDDWARLAYESVLDGAAHGVVYRESFFTPARHLASGQRLSDIVAGIDEGLSAGEAETGVEYRLIGDIDRAFGAGAGLEFVEGLVALRRANAPGMHRVIGVGMDSTERGIDPRIFKPAYDLARSAGFRLTGHQGENSTAADIALVIDELGAERIDHGLPVLDDPELTARMVGEQIPITVCPTSNVLISNSYSRLDQHILPDMRAAGLLATVNTDDPAFIALDLAAEYAAVAAAFDWDWDTMVQLSLDGVAATWLDETDKSALADRVRRSGASLREER